MRAQWVHRCNTDGAETSSPMADQGLTETSQSLRALTTARSHEANIDRRRPRGKLRRPAALRCIRSRAGSTRRVPSQARPRQPLWVDRSVFSLLEDVAKTSLVSDTETARAEGPSYAESVPLAEGVSERGQPLPSGGPERAYVHPARADCVYMQKR